MRRKIVAVHIQAFVCMCFLFSIGVSAEPPEERTANDAPAPGDRLNPDSNSPGSPWVFGDDGGRYIPDDELPEGSEVDGIRVSLEVERVRVSQGDPIVVDFEISNTASWTRESYHTYIPWILELPIPQYEIRAVDEQGKDRRVWGGHGKDVTWDVLHLPPGRFCGFRTECELPPGKYQLCAIFQNRHTRPPGISISVTTDEMNSLSKERRAEITRGIDRQSKRIALERARLGDHEFWTGRVISEKVAVEVTGEGGEGAQD